jgi:hypothetical protein
MHLIDTLTLEGRPQNQIGLYTGDLTEVPADEAFDLLLVSAFPDDYLATPTSLIGALERKGLSTKTLSLDKDVDLREAYSCWLSKEFTPADPGLRFKRLMCFEPLARGNPPEVIGDIFRALIPVIAAHPEIKSMALPLVATGDQRHHITSILPPLLESAIHWFRNGLSLDCLKIVIHKERQLADARHLFQRFKDSLRREEPAPTPANPDFDVFISYSSANTVDRMVLENELRALNPNLRLFIDRNVINVGSAWQSSLFENLDRCNLIVALLSPEYLQSKVCKEEFNIAWMRSREAANEVLFPIFLYTAGLPTYMKFRQHLDCREGDQAKLRMAAQMIVDTLRGLS